MTPEWRRSSRCDTSSCLEVAFDGGQVAVRDSKDHNSPVLKFSPAEWQAFVEGVRLGEFEWPAQDVD